MAKSGSKFVTGIIAFLLGFIFAILVEVGAIFGVYMYATTQPIEKIMETIGMTNTDEDGNKIYINTDKENGGVETLGELIKALQDLAFEDGQLSIYNKCFDDIENLVPATGKLLDMIYGIVGEYIELDESEFEATAFTDLPQWLAGVVDGLRMVTLVDKLGIGAEDDSGLVETLLVGAETKYANITYNVSLQGEGEDEDPDVKLPVLYDYYTGNDEIGYTREALVAGSSTVAPYPNNLKLNDKAEWLQSVATDESAAGENYDKYTLAYVPCKVTANGFEQAEYSYGTYTYKDGNNKEHTFSVLEYGDDTDFIAVKTDDEGNYILNFDEVWASENTAKDATASNRYIGYSYEQAYARSYYEVKQQGDNYVLRSISGKNFLKDAEGTRWQLDALTLGRVMSNPFAPLDAVPVTDLLTKNTGDGDNIMVNKLFKGISLGDILNGRVDFDKIVQDLKVGDFIDTVEPDNKIMAFVVFRLSDLEKVEGEGYYKGIYAKYSEEETEVLVTLDNNGHIFAAYEIDENGIRGKEVAGVKIGELGTITDYMTLDVLMDIHANNAIMSYLGFGVSQLVEENLTDPLGNAYNFKGKYFVEKEVDGKTVRQEKVCYVTTEADGDNRVIKNAWYIDEVDGKQVAVRINGTNINKIAERMDNFADELTIKDIIGENDDLLLLKAIQNSTINGLPDKIKNLTVVDIFKEENINESPFLRQVKTTKLSELDKAFDQIIIQRAYAKEVYGFATEEEAKSPILASNIDENYHSEWLYYERSEHTSDGKTTYTFELVRGAAEELNKADFATEDAYKAAYDNALGHLSADQVAKFDAINYYTYGQAKGIWKLVLYSGGKEKAYTLNNIHNMVTASTGNIYNATLKDLHEAEIIEQDLTGKQLTYLKDKNDPNSTETVILNDITFAKLIDIVLALAN